MKTTQTVLSIFKATGTAHSLIPCTFQKFFFTWYL